MNNTKKQSIKQDQHTQEQQQQKARQGHEPKEQGQNPEVLRPTHSDFAKHEEHEYPELRLTR